MHTTKPSPLGTILPQLTPSRHQRHVKYTHTLLRWGGGGVYICVGDLVRMARVRKRLR